MATWQRGALGDLDDLRELLVRLARVLEQPGAREEIGAVLDVRCTWLEERTLLPGRAAERWQEGRGTNGMPTNAQAPAARNLSKTLPVLKTRAENAFLAAKTL